MTLPENLPTDFTVEFDLVPKDCGCGDEDLAFDGTSGIWSETSIRVQWSPATQTVRGGGSSPFTMMTPAELSEKLPGQLTRVIASFERNTLKLYTNGQRLYTLAERRFARGNVLRVLLGGQDEEQAVYLARLRVAEGAATVTATTAVASQTGTGMLSPPATTSLGQAATAAAASVTGLVVTTDAQGKATLKWTAVPDARTYATLRWNVNDPACCKNLSPPGASSTTEWQDGILADGTYAYRVYATTATGTVFGETRVTLKNGVLGETVTGAGAGSIASPAPAVPEPAPAPAPAPAPITTRTGSTLFKCAYLTNLTATPTSNTSAKLSWAGLSSQCQTTMGQSEYLVGYAVVRWDRAEGSGACPATYDEYVRSYHPDATTWSSSLTGYPHCVDVSMWPQNSLDDYGLPSGQTYQYRFWPVVGYKCTGGKCPPDQPYPPSEISVTLLQFNPLGGKPQVTVVVGLKATVGATLCNSYTDNCDVDITYQWKSASNAVSYLLTLDANDGLSAWWMRGGPYSILPSPTPSYKTSLIKLRNYPYAVRACLGIVTDPATPPDPRRAECVETFLP